MAGRQKKDFPHLYRYDADIRARGFTRVAGVDEAGRGCLAGPVVAAAVILPPEATIEGMNDSKQVRPAARERFYQIIIEQAIGVGVGVIEADEIDRINILQATYLAAHFALAQLDPPPDFTITDYLKLAGLAYPVEAIVKGDATSASVAAASIIAKVTRDRLMMLYDAEYPGYAFSGNKGYGSAAHLDALLELGPTTIHRRSFNGVSFFQAESRPSSTFQQLERRIQTASSSAAYSQLREEIAAQSGHLPRVERQLLEARLSKNT
jgi:ribonuclease HII